MPRFSTKTAVHFYRPIQKTLLHRSRLYDQDAQRSDEIRSFVRKRSGASILRSAAKGGTPPIL